MTPLLSYLTVLMTFLFLTACGAKSSGNSAGSTAPLDTGVAGQALVAASSSSSIAAGGTTTFSVIGGTAPYNWTVTSGGGTLNSSTGASVVYTASNTAGLAYVTVSDSAGHTTSASVNVVGSTTGTPVDSSAGKVC